jgi:hypothetical protein
MGTGHLSERMPACCCVLALACALTLGASGCGLGEPPVCPGESDAEADAEDTGPGMLEVVGTFTNTTCPEVNPIGVGPDSGGLVSLTATVAGAAPDGSALSYLWAAPAGSFSDPGALDTSYRCPGAGVISVTLTAMAGPSCQNEAIALVTCEMVYAGPL